VFDIREPPVATRRPTLALDNAGRTALLKSCPAGRLKPHPRLKVRTGRRALKPTNGRPHLCRRL